MSALEMEEVLGGHELQCILQFVGVPALVACSRVSWAFHEAVAAPQLWRRLVKRAAALPGAHLGLDCRAYCLQHHLFTTWLRRAHRRERRREREDEGEGAGDEGEGEESEEEGEGMRTVVEGELEWQARELPFERYQYSVSSVGGAAYLLGGQASTRLRYSEVWRYSGRWELLAPAVEAGPLTPYSRHTACTHAGSIWLFGGFDGFSRKYELQQYRPDTNTFTCNIQTTGTRPSSSPPLSPPPC